MNYHILIKAGGGPQYFAHAVNCSLQTVYGWASKGLPRKYRCRLALIDAVEALDINSELKTLCLDFVRDPRN